MPLSVSRNLINKSLSKNEAKIKVSNYCYDVIDWCSDDMWNTILCFEAKDED